jgi:hypothetical protein
MIVIISEGKDFEEITHSNVFADLPFSELSPVESVTIFPSVLLFLCFVKTYMATKVIIAKIAA